MCVGKSIERRLGHRLESDLYQRVRDHTVGSYAAPVWHRVVDVHQHDLSGAVTLEGEPAGQQPKQHDPDCVEIAPPIERIAPALLRKPSIAGAADHAGHGEPALAIALL